MSGVLVTGASGFIGNHLLPLLVNGGFEVHAVCRTSAHFSRNPRVQWHQADLLDREQAKNLVRKVLPERLLHLAWYTTPPLYWEAAENRAWVQASIGLFREFADAGGQRMVALGSCAEYDWSNGYCDEDTTALAPVSLYGKSKKELHLMLSELAKAAGIEAVWARVFFPYGPGEPPSKLMTYIATSLLRGAPADCSTPELRRDFVYAADTASALVAVLQSSFSGAINIGTGMPVKVGEIGEKIAHKIGRPELLRFKESAQTSKPASMVVANIGKLRDRVRWAPAFSLDEGIEKTIDYCRLRILR